MQRLGPQVLLLGGTMNLYPVRPSEHSLKGLWYSAFSCSFCFLVRVWAFSPARTPAIPCHTHKRLNNGFSPTILNHRTVNSELFLINSLFEVLVVVIEAKSPLIFLNLIYFVFNHWPFAPNSSSFGSPPSISVTPHCAASLHWHPLRGAQSSLYAGSL